MASKEEKPLCKFGANCYRKNPQHIQNYRHPKRKHDSEDDQQKETKKVKKTEVSPEKTHKTITDFFGGKKKEKTDNGTAERDSDKEPKASSSNDSEETDSHDTKDVAESVESKEESVESKEESVESDEESLPSPDDVAENIKRKFLVEMPEDFFEFWEFCCHLDKKKPRDALHDVLGYQLVGPFDILAGRHKGVRKNKHGRKPNYLLHWRYYYDPPEFMTVIKGDNKSQFHLGYLRDDPSEMPVMVAANSAAESCNIIPKGDNLFAAVKNCIDEQIKAKGTDGTKKKKLQDIQDEVIEWAKKKKYSLDLKSKGMKERDKKVVCKTFHGAGIVVPVDDNEVGYRPVPETTGDLKKMMKKVAESKTDKERDENMDPIQELITLVQFANDECDYGEGLELGMDLFCYGDKVFRSMMEHLLPLAYQLLGRIEYEQIIKAHLKSRQKGTDLSQLD
ncbi:Putative histone PARylation factor 1-like,Histone PARylation factor 1 [Mytilus coruscus]|uniref:Histone PARylation factor 1-like,Histone PARylation factor 1 n=1 Tax=Mytilus coruscus TaxID=42192 RepID=A0A6J8F0X0_MYTCO|nr:Putative histone PARylation factor 1-like,Histone PARylation factor 1 [Mytilus coruscus]